MKKYDLSAESFKQCWEFYKKWDHFEKCLTLAENIENKKSQKPSSN